MPEDQDELKKSAEIKLQRWLKILGGDTNALIEIMNVRGMATEEDLNKELNINI